MSEQFVNGDTSNATDTDTDLVLDDASNEVDVDALVETNKRLYARAKRAEGFSQQSDGSWVKVEKPKQSFTNVEQKPYNILEDDVADLILGGYSKEETKFILANGGRTALDNKDSYVSIAINAKREQARVEDAVSQTSSNGYMSTGGKTYTDEQMRNMSTEELAAILPHA